MVNKSTTVKRFVLHTLQCNLTHLAVITRKTNIKLGILRGGDWKRAFFFSQVFDFVSKTTIRKKNNMQTPRFTKTYEATRVKNKLPQIIDKFSFEFLDISQKTAI